MMDKRFIPCATANDTEQLYWIQRTVLDEYWKKGYDVHVRANANDGEQIWVIRRTR